MVSQLIIRPDQRREKEEYTLFIKRLVRYRADQRICRYFIVG